MSSPASFNRPGVSDEFLRRHKIHHVREGIAIPYFTAAGLPVMRDCDHGRQYTRIRLTHPVPFRGPAVSDEDHYRHASGGQRYTQPKGSRICGYIPLALVELAQQKICDELTLVEGEFKALAHMEAGFPAVAIGGIASAFVGRDLVSGLKEIIEVLPLRRLYFLGDADTSLLFAFSREAVKLAKRLAPIPVLLPRIGLRTDGAKGIDDIRAQLGDAFPDYWAKLKAEAEPVAATDTPERLASRLLLREDTATLREALSQ